MFKQYWYLWLAAGGLCVLTAVVIVLASRAVSSHNAQIKQQLEQLKRLKLLKDKYKSFEREVLESADSAEVLEGTCAVLQSRIEKADDAEAEFAAFNNAQKYVYTLYYFLEDVQAECLSFFFRNNGAELCSLAADALTAVGYRSAEPLVSREWDMFNEDNEEASVDAAQLEITDSRFAQTFDRNAFLGKVKQYVIDNADSFKV